VAEGSSTKAQLRARYRRQRSEVTQHELARASGRISELFFRTFDLGAVRMVSTYIPIRRHNEIDTRQVFTRIWHEFPHVATVAPVADLKTGMLQCVPFTSTSTLIEDRWGISEPQGHPTDPLDIDLVLVPLLAFDKRGHRLGYGRGFYDRFLLRCRSDCLKVGLSLFDPTPEPIPTGDHDVPLDACVTPSMAFNF
jgi:5-formyltetrahydrofolate cyclo-ligase